MEQRSPEWYEARRHRLTASDFGSAANLKNAYKSRQKLWEIKTGREVIEPNEFMQYGTDMEPVAKFSYENLSGNLVDDVGFVVHPDLDFLGSSPDGLIDTGSVLEIKCPIKQVHSAISEQFIAQVHGHLACTQRKTGFFFSWHPEGQRLWEITWSQEYWDWLFPLLQEFWNYVLDDERPPKKSKQQFDGEIQIKEIDELLDV